MKTATLLPFVRVTIYDSGKYSDKVFKDSESANNWLAESGVRLANIYRIEKINGTWRTDWEMA